MTFPSLRHRYTLQDYLDLEKTSNVRHEYLDGEIYAMAGGSLEHAALCAALIGEMVRLTAAGRCRTYTSDLRIVVLRTGLRTYPDATVVCGPPETDPQSPTDCTNPTVIFEVLSPSSEYYDRGVKREHYQQIDSLREYFVVAQDRRHAERWARDSAGGWNHQVIGPDDELAVESVGGSFSLRELYSSAGL
jgi:Uma2 family endonuclease